ncbi:bifunctional aspartyl/glutamyl-tRNA(Asn/Gln) amidotransferase subunit B/aspartate--tRNA(Asp/Asn) ligase [Polaribacter reichenbachii]|uniref:Multifunctional fusion protein n=1 Tax=Polaribacter reichenbachii TaxID=996801 RepID=A0A1B8TW61_9FLAO|nr:bifunctional amidotransferase subunit GatB/aspartate--tRNA ligase AspS [Polaribacter reichenbachii]APZ45151.1 bifunctional aspartyl/glutamyl-tRNA(Asn/Gln) amidotransferase subunit B/aspartate--tRNA(Asp/Asn) ligase [Polaribacter reichenbachii]AUC19013.1 bifunctional aspartyl/glutamyl-tRNA(Asn/Gln) amidotransferase subunit B/aspartate--tRNA(Asp/Asn) ligase [Polaribacter reichenbachii]OBY63830.1 bifunctional aspartyl/glutamyl-tRNA(Asn/Gln) amidotransferase subunit B/aspartate--tRNA(Asp/Asn) liga
MELEKLNNLLKKYDLELVIGLETHVRLNTKTKLFCSCANTESAHPNTNICSVCTGQMGVLPSINKEAITKAIYFGKAVKSTFENEVISWDRKHYEYPDNPKNIQITQFHNPVIPDGQVSCFRNDGSQFTVNLTQVHIEEDAAKLMHEKKVSLVDFNKAGVPLIEIVTEPCIRHIEDASTYAQYIQRIVQNLKISEANLEKGEFKSDVSVSLRKKHSYNLNPRTEIKNLNSFKFMIEALKEEVEKQLNYYIEHKEFRPDQTTVLFDADLKQTKTMRKKEFEADYRFISEPDLPFVSIKNVVESIDVDVSSLPFAVESILIKGGVLPQDAKFFTADSLRSETFIAINNVIKDPSFVAKTLVNNIGADEYANIHNVNQLIEIFQLFKADKITSVLVQNGITRYLKDRTFDYNKYFEQNTISEDKIKDAVQKVINENEAIANDIKNGNQGKAGILVGKVIKIIGKGASGKVIREEILNAVSENSALINSPLAVSEKPRTKSQQPAAKNEEELQQTPIIIKDNYRSHKISELSDDAINTEVTLSGWVSSVRDHGELIFIDLRDSSYQVFQVRLSRETFPNLDELVKLKPETVIMVTGVVVQRREDDYNTGLRTGKIELETSELEILNLSKTLPFEIKRAMKTNENVRFQYKFLDHRNDEVRKAIVNRHKVIKLLRDILDEEEFLEIETPILTAGTDEGAREFIVPTRKQAGSFYTLPQAPQQFKQMLMVGGFEKYFQIARCFRDEDSRGDRQPEFTQLDIEMAYASMQQIIDLNTKMFNEIVKKIYGKKWILRPFEVITYKEAMDKYGCDRPDLRYGLEMQDITEIVKDTTFQVFSKPIDEGGIVKCIKVSAEEQGNKRMSKGQIENLTAIAQQNGLGGLAYIIVNENDLQSPIIKFLGEEIAANIIKATDAQIGDIVFFSAADYATANKALDAVRQEMGRILKLINPKELRPAWVVDFPMFEKTDEGRWTFTHNPFSMPAVYDLEKHMNGEGEEIGTIIAQQYDLILNGYEIGGGSVRAHKAEILEATYKNMGYNKEEMIKSVGTMYKAFQYGAPPHGGIAWGVDRLMMILEKKTSIREVMAFPKTGTSEDLLFNAPSILSDKKVEEMNVKIMR